MQLADYAKTFLGVTESNPTFKWIIDNYNTQCRRANTYRMTYNDEWCATFVSLCLTHCGYGISHNSVNCNEFYSLNRRYEIDRAKANKNDIVLYSWQNNENLQHIGIISARSGNYVTVIEGNKSEQVGTRQIGLYSKAIRHIIRMPSTYIPSNSPKSIEQIAKDVIAGKYGTGDTRKKALEAKGYNYKDVQHKVNELLKGKSAYNVTTIAKEVIAGKYGNGEDRKKAIESKGYNYNEVQKKVNELLKK